MQVLGIQVDRPFLRAALIEKSRRGIEILRLKTASLAEPDDVKQLYTSSYKGKVASGLSAKNLIVRSLEVKISGHRHLEEVVAFQSEAASHFDPSEVLSVPYFLKTGKEKTEALLFTAPREAVREHLLELQKLELDPDFVSAVPLALISYVQWKIPTLFDAFIIDLGSYEWTCIWMEKGQLKKSHSLEGGVEILLSALEEDRKKILSHKEVENFAKQIDLLQLKTHLNPHLSSRLSEMRRDLAKIIFSFHRSSGSRPLFFTGRIDALGHIREFLIDGLKESISGECNRAISAEEQKYAVSIGLALEQYDRSLQFRRGEFFPRKHWKSAGIYSLSLMAASLLIGGALVNITNRAAQARKGEMVSFLRSSSDRWNPSFKQAIFANSGEEILEQWNLAVSSHSKEYPYLLQAPKVAEVLSWLSSHPLLTVMNEGKDPIEILSIRYQLVQFPKIDAAQDPYQAKMELEFKTKSPMNARKFHEALLQGDVWADPSQEVGWEALSDFYRVSFFLKNRSPYVP